MGILRPQVITTENVLTSFVQPAGPRVAALIATAQWGPINTIKSISNLSDYISTFGGDKSGTGLTGIKAADLFFRNGGTLKVVRIDDGDAAKANYMAQEGSTDQINFEAKYKGTKGDEIGVTVTANANTAANRDIEVTDGNILEVFNNGGDGYADNDAIAAAINADSSLVTAAVEAGEGANIIDAITQTFLTGGDDGEDSLSNSDYTDAMDNVLLTEDYNFLLIPGVTDDSLHATIVGKLNTRASNEKKYSRYITGVAKNESISTINSRTSSGKRISLCAPNVKYTHRIDDTQDVYDGSYLACAYAGLLCRLDREISGTHETLSVEGLSVNSSTGKEFYTKVEQENVLQSRAIPFSLIGGSIQASRGVTRESDTTSVFFDEVVVDIVDFVRAEVEDYTSTTIGKPNTEDRRSIWAGRIDAILNNALREEIIQEFQPTTLVEGASPDTYIATVNIKPSFNVNFVQLTINVN